MTYSLNDKIISYLEDNGISGARFKDGILSLPNDSHVKIAGVVSSTKLDAIIKEYKEQNHGMQ